MFSKVLIETGDRGVRCAIRKRNLTELMRSPGPLPAEEADATESGKVYNSYWFKRQFDGLRKKDPSNWCRGSMPAMYGFSQREREMANAIGRLTLDWLF